MRTLSDLYITGKSLSIDDGSGDPVEVWLQKLNPIQNEQVGEAANMERVKYLSIRRQPEDTPQVQILKEELNQTMPDRKDRTEFISAKEDVDAWRSAEAETEFEDEWAKDSYLEGIKTLFESQDFQAKLIANPEDPDVKRITDDLTKFNAQVEENYNKRHRILMSDYDKKPIEEIDKLALEKMIEANADRAWLVAMRKMEIYLACRQPDDHKTFYFADRSKVDELDYVVLGELIRGYSNLTATYQEGKG